MRRLVLVAMMLVAVAAWAEDRSKEVDRLESAATVLDEVMSAPDAGIPNTVINSAKCIAIVPSMLKGGFVVGAAYGRGVASCHSEKGWSAPAFFRLDGGSFGLQIGGQAVDVVMLIMNDQGMKNLLSSKFKLGADASVAAGPVGRQAEGSTDITMRAQILTYSRARGVFAGLTLNGASVREDRSSAAEFYGRRVPFRSLLRGEVAAPAEAQPWISTLAKWTGTGTPVGSTPPPPPETQPAPTPTESESTSNQ